MQILQNKEHTKLPVGPMLQRGRSLSPGSSPQMNKHQRPRAAMPKQHHRVHVILKKTEAVQPQHKFLQTFGHLGALGHAGLQ
eukprot:6464742-Amphidinium_carterae.1